MPQPAHYAPLCLLIQEPTVGGQTPWMKEALALLEVKLFRQFNTLPQAGRAPIKTEPSSLLLCPAPLLRTTRAQLLSRLSWPINLVPRRQKRHWGLRAGSQLSQNQPPIWRWDSQLEPDQRHPWLSGSDEARAAQIPFPEASPRLPGVLP